MSTGSTITKTVWQYSEPLPDETMAFLRGIADDCCKVKNYVYGKYSGVRYLNSLTPAYGILNEMRRCGLREQLNLPAVYYSLARACAVRLHVWAACQAGLFLVIRTCQPIGD